MINVSKLRWRIALFYPGAPIDDGFTTRPGSLIPADGEDGRAAQYLPGTVREVFEAAARESQLPAAFIVRRDAISATIDATWKLLFEGDCYDVQGATRHDTDGMLIRAIASDNPWGGGGYST